MTTLITAACTLVLVALVLGYFKDLAHKLGHQLNVWPSDCTRCSTQERVLELEGQLDGARNLAAATLQGNVVEADVRPPVGDADLAAVSDTLLPGQRPRLTEEISRFGRISVAPDCRGGLTRTPAQALASCTRETTALGRANQRAAVRKALANRAPTNAEIAERAKRKLTPQIILGEEAD